MKLAKLILIFLYGLSCLIPIFVFASVPFIGNWLKEFNNGNTTFKFWLLVIFIRIIIYFIWPLLIYFIYFVIKKIFKRKFNSKKYTCLQFYNFYFTGLLITIFIFKFLSLDVCLGINSFFNLLDVVVSITGIVISYLFKNEEKSIV